MIENVLSINSVTNRQQMQALVHITERLAVGANLSATLKTIFEESVANTGADGGHISLNRDAEGAFIPRYQRGDTLPKQQLGLIEQEVLRNQRSAVRDNLNSGSTIKSVVIAPILYEGNIAGLISLYGHASNHFDKSTVAFVTTLANVAATAIVNAQLYQDTLRRERFYAALGRVSLALSATVNLPTVLRLVCKESLQLFKVHGAYIWQRQGDRLVGIAAEGYAKDDFIGTEISYSDKNVFAALVANQGYGQFLNDFGRQEKINPFPWQSAVKAVLAVPLRKDEEVMGLLELADTARPARFSPPDIDQAAYFGTQAATAIQNAQLLTEMRELNEQLDMRVADRTQALGHERDRVRYLLRVTSELAASLDQDRVLIRALELVNEIVNATHGSILLVDSSTGDLIYPSAFETHKLPPLPRVDLGYKPEEGFAGWIVSQRSSVIVDDTLDDDRWIASPESSDLRSVMAVPLIANDEVIGVLTLFHREPNAFSSQQLELVEAAAMQVANAISNAQLYLLIRDQAERLGSMLRDEHVEAAKNQSILESIADGVLVTDTKGNVILANISAGQILEFQREQLIGKSINELMGLYAATGKNWMHTVDDWSGSTRRLTQSQYLAERLTIEDKVVSLRLSPVYASDQFFGTVSIFRDVTQDVAVDRMKSEFVSTVSHELRTPMTSIKGYAELMLMGAAGPMSDCQQLYLEVIIGNASRMSDLINDLLDISRIESGKTTLEFQSIELPPLIEQVIDDHLQGLIEHEGKYIKVESEIPPSLPMIYADTDRVIQILTNLLDNAFHYTPDDGKIKVVCETDDVFVKVSVVDTGIGISPENQEKIFDRFYRVEDTEIQEVPGTGLGLAIVRSLVEMHNGVIKVRSKLGEGSTFTITLPIVMAEMVA